MGGGDRSELRETRVLYSPPHSTVHAWYSPDTGSNADEPSGSSPAWWKTSSLFLQPSCRCVLANGIRGGFDPQDPPWLEASVWIEDWAFPCSMSRYSGNNTSRLSRILIEWKSQPTVYSAPGPGTAVCQPQHGSALKTRLAPPPTTSSSDSPPCYTLTPPNKAK